MSTIVPPTIPTQVPDRPKLLDLFCCAGGAATGYQRAGFDVFGVDIDPQPHYPLPFCQGDAITVLEGLLDAAEIGFTWPTFVDPEPTWLRLSDFDAIHASPPCQRFSDLAKRNGNAHEWPDLVEPVRELLAETGLPYVIENVEGAPLVDPITLCGAMFPELRVYRHRLFESNRPLVAPEHPAHNELTFTHDKRKRHYGQPLDLATMRVQVTGGGNAPVWAKRAAMGGLNWMTGREVNEAIPPAYTECLGRQVLAYIDGGERDGVIHGVEPCPVDHCSDVIRGQACPNQMPPSLADAWWLGHRDVCTDCNCPEDSNPYRAGA
jgi:DNA (cytosine-5)-methyltransferase 1